MPVHCDPWPGKTKTVRPVAAAFPVTTFGAGAPEAIAANPLNNSSRSAPTTTARWSNDARVVTNEYATSCGSTSGCCSTNRRNRAACSASADADFADNTHGVTGGRVSQSTSRPQTPAAPARVSRGRSFR